MERHSYFTAKLRLYRLEAGRFASRLLAQLKRQSSRIPYRWSRRPTNSATSFINRPADQLHPRCNGHADELEVVAFSGRFA
jgi:hypothetical protein